MYPRAWKHCTIARCARSTFASRRIAVAPGADPLDAASEDPTVRALSASCDRSADYERQSSADSEPDEDDSEDSEDEQEGRPCLSASRGTHFRTQPRFSLFA